MTVTREELERIIAETRDEVADPRAGLFGPGSLAWQVSKEAVLFLGGGRAALLQLAHPFVAHAVNQHSATRTDPLGRFQRTFENVFAITFGDLDSAIRSARRVHAVHTRVRGVIDEDVGAFRRGARYEATDEEALLWVHATLADTSVLVYERVVGALTEGQKDQYIVEMNRFARLFGVPRALLPTSWRDFQAYMQRMLASDVIRIGAPARDIASFLFATRRAVYGPLYRWLGVVTAGLLPERVRSELALPFGPSEQALYRSSWPLLRATHATLPRRLRYQPAYVAARRRLAGRAGPDRVGAWIEHATEVALSQAPLWTILRLERRARSVGGDLPREI